ncbi:hypothetical protein T265_10793 [Opisthorchis viverrini]|uniref:Uncharacterized protein n=1 Tax=Opisthorchis viverrini TaxID=6198 RepID=A0A074ZC13_OPIVI|nr:hypothetical protein T265_10793 [Opisthorchis viverrini]KER20740.1 hypothetical protein T265_10793 [Opisthorchis viverrini]
MLPKFYIVISSLCGCPCVHLELGQNTWRTLCAFNATPCDWCGADALIGKSNAASHMVKEREHRKLLLPPLASHPDHADEGHMYMKELRKISIGWLSIGNVEQPKNS